LARHSRTPRFSSRIAEDERNRSTAGNPAEQGDWFRLGQVVEAYVTVSSGGKDKLASRFYTIPTAGTFYVFVYGSRAEVENYAHFPFRFASSDQSEAIDLTWAERRAKSFYNSAFGQFTPPSERDPADQLSRCRFGVSYRPVLSPSNGEKRPTLSGNPERHSIS
jgi:hypothetical protein